MNQLDRPQKGEPVAVIHTSMGDISIRLFPGKTPKTCENFMTHAKNGYYNGLIFHRVIPDFMIQGGDPTGTGCGGESIWGDSFEDETDIELRNYRGALSMANAGPNTNGIRKRSWPRMKRSAVRPTSMSVTRFSARFTTAWMSWTPSRPWKPGRRISPGRTSSWNPSTSGNSRESRRRRGACSSAVRHPAWIRLRAGLWRTVLRCAGR